MWPFKKKHAGVKFDHFTANVEKFKEFRDIGETFNYLGIKMMCTGHVYAHFGARSTTKLPQLSADYVDSRGDIQNIAWPISELPCLLAENPEE